MKLLVYVKFVLRTIIYHERVYFLQLSTTFSLVFPVMRMNSIPPLFSALHPLVCGVLGANSLNENTHQTQASTNLGKAQGEPKVLLPSNASGRVCLS